MNLLVGIMLTVCAVEDGLTRKISVQWPLMGLAIGVIIRLMEGTIRFWEGWIGLLSGLVFLLLAIISREQIGKGDGLILTVCGFCLGWKRLLSLVLGAMGLFLAAGIWKLFVRKQKRKTIMAFIPFLWLMYLFSLIV